MPTIYSSLRRKLNTIWIKNGVDIQATLTGSLPRFLYRSGEAALEKEVPVLVFHSVEANLFEEQLQYLSTNGYKTLDADDLLATLQGARPIDGPTVALTFDDATGSFWAVAYPLLKKYQFKAILFVIPGLVPPDSKCYPNLEDVWRGRADQQDVVKRERIQPLCTWPELMTMHESGLVDMQSHSLTHSRINVSPTVVDFIHPHFDPHFFENVNLPVSRDDAVERPLRPLRLGQPVYESASRLSGRRRFLENSDVSAQMVRYVAENGGEFFFRHPDWHSKLAQHYKQLASNQPDEAEYESQTDTEAAIRRELTHAKEWLETKFDKKIYHLCYPWYQGCALSDKIAAECGYLSLFYGLDVAPNNIPMTEIPVRIRRVSEEYLFSLPGQGRRSLTSTWLNKITRVINKK